MPTAYPNSTDTDTAASSNDVEAQMRQLKQDLASLSRTVADLGASKASDAGARAQALRDEIAAQLLAFKDTLAQRSVATAGLARDRLATAESEIEDRVRAHPLAAIGIAAGIGFLFAKMSKK